MLLSATRLRLLLLTGLVLCTGTGAALLLTCSQAFAQASFQYYYAYPSGASQATAIDRDANGYIVAGFVQNGTNGRDALLMRLDLNGNVVWSQTYGGTGDDVANGVRATPVDNGYVFAGSTTGFGATGRDIWVVKVNSTGAVQWSRRFHIGVDDDARFNPLHITTTNDIVVVGYGTTTGSGAATARNTFAARISNTGVVAWTNNYEVSNVTNVQDFAVAVTQTPTGTYLIAGNTGINLGSPLDGYLMEVSAATGAIQNGPYTFDFQATGSNDIFSSIQRTADNQYIVGGVNTGNVGTAGSQDLLLTKIDLATQARTFVQSIGVGGLETGGNAQQAPDGGYYGTGFASDLAAGNTGGDIMVYKTNGTGTLTWSTFLGGTGRDSVAALVTAPAGGGLVLVGFTESFGVANRSIYIAKVDDAATQLCRQVTGTFVAGTPGVNPNVLFTTNSAGPAAAQPAVNALALNPARTNICCIGFTAGLTADIVCLGQPTTLASTSTVTPNTTYDWYFDTPVTGPPTVSNTGPTAQFTFATPGIKTVTLVVRTTAGCADTATITTVVQGRPTANAAVQGTLPICSGQSITISGTTSTGGPLAYRWSPATGLSATNVAAPLATPLATTTYTLIVTNDITGCADTTTVQVTVTPPPAVNAGADRTICRGATTTLAGTGAAGATYQWSPAALFINPNIQNPTTLALDTTVQVSVLLTAPGGCQARDTMTINVVRVDAPDTLTLCEGISSVTLTSTVNVGNGGVAFNWTPAGPGSNTNSYTVSPLVDTKYFVNINRGGCLDRDSVFVRVRPAPPAAAGNDTAICTGQTATLRATGGVAYAWRLLAGGTTGIASPNAANTNVSPTASTDYVVRVTDIFGCQAEDTVRVVVNPLPGVDLGPDQQVCFGQCINLDAGLAGVAYSWTFTGASNQPNPVRNPLVCPTANTTYTVTVTDANGCVNVDDITLTVPPKPQAVVTPGNSTVCRGQQVCLEASGAGNYFWITDNPNDTDPGFNPGTQLCFTADTTETYRVVPFVGPCRGDTVVLTISVNPQPLAGVDLQPVSCSNDTILVTYTGTRVPSDVAIWNFGANANVLSGSGFGPYQITFADTGNKVISVLVNALGCTSIDTAEVRVFSEPLVDAGPDLAFCNGSSGVVLRGSSFNASGGTCTYRWSPFSGLDNPFSLTPTARPLVTTTYYLRAFCNGCDSRNIDSVTITVFDQPVAVLDTFEVGFCAGSGGVVLPGSGFGGNGALFYEWYPNTGLSNIFSPTPIANPTTTTRYCLVVRDANGCPSDSACILARVDPLPIANAGPDKFVCAASGQGAFLDGSATGAVFGSYTYEWSPTTGLSDPFSPTPFARPAQTTIYTLRVVSNQTGCSSIPTTLDTLSTVTVHVTPTPVADAGPDLSICAGENVVLGGVPFNCVPLCTYAWTPALGLSNPTAANPTASPSQTTTYYLKVLANGCESVADSVTVTVLPAPTLDILRDVITVCPGEPVKLETTLGGIQPGANVTYQWSPAAGLSNPTAAEPIATVNQTTVFRLLAFADGCQGPIEDTVRINILPAPQINVAQRSFVRCYEDPDSIPLPVTITNAPGPYLFSWNTSRGLSDSTAVSPLARPDETTKYFITVVYGGCTIRDSVEITVLPRINAQLASGRTTICRGDTVNLAATGGQGSATFTWLQTATGGLTPTSATTAVAQPTATTTYQVVVRENGCADTAQVTITVLPRPLARFGFSYPGGCDQLRVSFADSSTDAIGYLWSFGDGTVSNETNPVHRYAHPGTYTVTLRVSALEGSCADSLTATTLVRVGQGLLAGFITSPEPPADLPLPDATLTVTDTTTGAVSWLWQFGDGATSTLRQATHRYTQAGLYTVTLTVTDAAGCTAVAQKRTFTVFDPLLTVTNVFTPNGDGIHDEWRVQYTGQEPFSLNVYDRWGNEMFFTNTPTEGWVGTTQGGSAAPEGVYFYLIEIGDRRYDGQFTLLR